MLLPASPSFCQSVTAVSRTSSLRMIAFKRQPEWHRLQHTVTGTMKIEPAAVWNRDFYLLEVGGIFQMGGGSFFFFLK